MQFRSYGRALKCAPTGANAKAEACSLRSHPHPPPTKALEGRLFGTLSRKREREKPHGCTTVIVAGDTLPMPRMSGRYMSSTSGGGTVYVPGVTARTR